MTDQELATLAAELEAADTEIAALDQQIIQAIANARVHNSARKVHEAKRDEIKASVQPKREAIARHMQEAKRLAGEKARAEAEAKAKEPKPPSEIELLREQVAKLTAAVEAKG